MPAGLSSSMTRSEWQQTVQLPQSLLVGTGWLIPAGIAEAKIAPLTNQFGGAKNVKKTAEIP